MIVFSFAISGFLAAAVAVLLTVQSPLVTPDFGVQVTIFALVGVVVGGLDRLLTATMGGFAIGFATSFLGARLPVVEQRLPAVDDLRPRHPRAADPPRRALLAGARTTAAERV